MATLDSTIEIHAKFSGKHLKCSMGIVIIFRAYNASARLANYRIHFESGPFDGHLFKFKVN
jgi:hypothetical protein